MSLRRPVRPPYSQFLPVPPSKAAGQLHTCQRGPRKGRSPGGFRPCRWTGPPAAASWTRTPGPTATGGGGGHGEGVNGHLCVLPPTPQCPPSAPHLADDGVGEDAVAIGPPVVAGLGGRPIGRAVGRAVGLQEVPLGLHVPAAALGAVVVIRGDGDKEGDVADAVVGHRPGPAVVLGDAGGEVLQKVVAGQHEQRKGQRGHVGHLEASHPAQACQQLHEGHGGTRDGAGRGPRTGWRWEEEKGLEEG